MNENEIELIRTSYVQIRPDLPRLAAYFYNRLQELDSSLDNVMEDDVKNGGQLFCAFFEHFVNSLEELDRLVPELKLFADQLQECRVTAPDCIQSVGVTFIDTLAFGFRYAFSQELTNAWTKAFRNLADRLAREMPVKA